MTTIAVTPQKNMLARVIQADATYCAAAGAASILFAEPIATMFGLENRLYIMGVGLILVLYAADLFWMVSRGWANTRLGWATVILNLAWIDGTLVLLFTDLLPLQPAGRWLLILAGIGVLIFGLLQAYTTWQLRKSA